MPLPVRFYNTLSRRLEPFEPLEPPDVTMYNCGPTVYDDGHIGNFRSFLFADILRRFLELMGHRVRQVMNLTDVGHMTQDTLADGGGEDKMQVAARRINEAKKAGKVDRDAVANPDDPRQVAQYYIERFVQDARQVGLKVADEYFPDDPARNRVPRASDHVPQMQAMIQRLLDTGRAYVADDAAVYFSVESFPAYGNLSGNTLEKLRGGAGGRVLDKHQAHKRHPADFLLWKPDKSHIMKWPSPWGEGYPGWHIECSAMATHVLDRPVIDIHTGGEDNIFPHHECEIAQSCGVTGRDTFARVWMHARLLLVGGEKMSKSKGNFHTVRDALEGRVTGRRVDPAVLRFELIRSHYRTNMNFTVKGLEDSASAVQRLRDAAAGARPGTADLDHPVVRDFAAALGDDLNISAALAVVFDWLRKGPSASDHVSGAFELIDSVLGVLPRQGVEATGMADAPDDAIDRCRRIDEARTNRDFATADQLRQELIEEGFEVKTGQVGTVARRKLA
jgi:cysteinyl-tRNA synthetase